MWLLPAPRVEALLKLANLLLKPGSATQTTLQRQL